MKPTDEQKQRMRKALLGVGISPYHVKNPPKWFLNHFANWETNCGGYDVLCECLEDAGKLNVNTIQSIYNFIGRWVARRKAENARMRIDYNDPETKEWLRRQQRGRTSPQDGQASSGVESRVMDRPLPNCGEVLQGPEQGGQGKVVGTDGKNGFIPAKRRRK